MAPKKRKAAPARARAQKTIERDVLTELRPTWAGGKQEEKVCCACLMPVEKDAEVGLVDACTHIFHFGCIHRWARTENSCPQCKVRFFWLAAYSPKGKRASLTRIEQKDQEGEELAEYEDVQVCEVCKEVGNEAALMLCDGMNGTCDAAYHYTCLGLEAIPRGSWFCPDCVERGFDTDARGRQRRGQAAQPQPRQEPVAVARASNQGGAGLAIDIERQATNPPPNIEEQPALAKASTDTGGVCPAEGVRSQAPGSSSGAAASASSASAAPSARGSGGPARPLASPSQGSGAPAGRGRGRGGRSGGTALPAHLRMSALACVTPAVEVPDAFRAGPAAAEGGTGAAAGGAAEGGLFASFAQRRRERQNQRRRDGGGASSSNCEPATTFINLNPTYEEDFMASRAAA